MNKINQILKMKLVMEKKNKSVNYYSLSKYNLLTSNNNLKYIKILLKNREKN
jgi:hypothetical protein